MFVAWVLMRACVPGNVLFRPIAGIRLQLYALRLRNLTLPKSQRLAAKQAFFKKLCPVGEDPFRYTVGVKYWAGEFSLVH